MATRICDLKLNLAKSPLVSRVFDLYGELSARNLRFRPPCYFADEWFVPEGDPVIGIPFYLANKQLSHLERKIIGEVEGSEKSYFMKLLRHEAGHAISYAFKLHRHKAYRLIFGNPQKKFSDVYRFNPKSKNYVLNLKDYYGQSHPDEDFAETFAVWLSQPESRWKRQYKGWGAIKKLKTVSHFMKDIENKPPLIRNGEKMCHVSTLEYTLRTYYLRRRSMLSHQTGMHNK